MAVLVVLVVLLAFRRLLLLALYGLRVVVRWLRRCALVLLRIALWRPNFLPRLWCRRVVLLHVALWRLSCLPRLLCRRVQPFPGRTG